MKKTTKNIHYKNINELYFVNQKGIEINFKIKLCVIYLIVLLFKKNNLSSCSIVFNKELS